MEVWCETVGVPFANYRADQREWNERQDPQLSRRFQPTPSYHIFLERLVQARTA